MRRFLYFLPGVSGCNNQMLKDRGLLTRFTTHSGTAIEHGMTPTVDGPAGSGCIVAAGSEPAAYEASAQTWMEADKFWVGMESALPPGPDDLARDIIFTGYKIVLGDGQTWQVPVIRRWEGDHHVSALPQTVRNVKSADGRNIGVSDISPRYAHMDALADKVWLSFIETRTMPTGEALADCGTLLGFSYRIGAEEISLLGLADEALLIKVLGLCVDSPEIEKRTATQSHQGLEVPEPIIEPEE